MKAVALKGKDELLLSVSMTEQEAKLFYSILNNSAICSIEDKENLSFRSLSTHMRAALRTAGIPKHTSLVNSNEQLKKELKHS